MSSVIVQMLPNLTLEPAPTAAGVCSTGLLRKEKPWSSRVPALSQRNVHSSSTPSVFCSCFSLLSVGPELGCSSCSLSFLTLPCTPCQGQSLPWGPEPAGERDPAAGQEGEYGNTPGHAATLWGLALSGMFRAPTCSCAFQRELLPELGSLSALPVLDKQNYCFHYSDPKHFQSSVSLRSVSLKKICELTCAIHTFHQSCKLLLFPLRCQSNTNLTDF